MGQITRQQRDTYVRAGGNACPYCGSRSMTSEVVMYDRLQGVIEVEVECLKCKKQWIDVFTLSSILDEYGRE
jgi:DNA-directed RNA polymerase subunit RPC12/RpoP